MDSLRVLVEQLLSDHKPGCRWYLYEADRCDCGRGTDEEIKDQLATLLASAPVEPTFDERWKALGLPSPSLAPCPACVSEVGRALPDCPECRGSGICRSASAPGETAEPPRSKCVHCGGPNAIVCNRCYGMVAYARPFQRVVAPAAPVAPATVSSASLPRHAPEADVLPMEDGAGRLAVCATRRMLGPASARVMAQRLLLAAPVASGTPKHAEPLVDWLLEQANNAEMADSHGHMDVSMALTYAASALRRAAKALSAPAPEDPR